MRIAILTVSDTRDASTDGTGDAIAAHLDAHEIVERALVPDEQDHIEAMLTKWCDGRAADLVITNGGTGLSPRDVTPEATKAVVEREVPGLPEAMRAKSPTFLAYLSRQAAGIRNGVLVMNLPGSPKAAIECLEAVMDILEHAVEMTK